MEAQIDYFEQWEELPKLVKEVLHDLEGCYSINGMTPEELDQVNEKFKAVGYSFEYGLDCRPFNLFRIS